MDDLYGAALDAIALRGVEGKLITAKSHFSVASYEPCVEHNVLVPCPAGLRVNQLWTALAEPAMAAGLPLTETIKGALWRQLYDSDQDVDFMAG